MKLKYHFILISSLFISNIVNCQLIDGPANCRNSINGEIIYVLNDSTFIYAHEPNNNWYKIRVDANIDPNDYSNGILKKGAKLLRSDGVVFGETKQDIETELDEFYAGGKDYTMVHIESYTYKSNIRTNTILEREVERIMKIEDISMRDNELKGITEDFGFYPHEIDGYTVYTTYDGIDYMGSAEFRMFIYFKGNDLVAIAKDWRMLNIKSLKRDKIDRDFDIYYFVAMSDQEEKEFKDSMDNAFRFRD